MSEFEKEVIENLVSGNIDNITWDDISKRMEDKQEELDQAVKLIEQLDNEAQQKSMTYYVI